MLKSISETIMAAAAAMLTPERAAMRVRVRPRSAGSVRERVSAGDIRASARPSTPLMERVGALIEGDAEVATTVQVCPRAAPHLAARAAAAAASRRVLSLWVSCSRHSLRGLLCAHVELLLGPRGGGRGAVARTNRAPSHVVVSGAWCSRAHRCYGLGLCLPSVVAALVCVCHCIAVDYSL